MTKTTKELVKMRACAPFLPDPGSEVVFELLDEIDIYRRFIGDAIISDSKSHAMRRELLCIPDDMSVSEFMRGVK